MLTSRNLGSDVIGSDQRNVKRLERTELQTLSWTKVIDSLRMKFSELIHNTALFNIHFRFFNVSGQFDLAFKCIIRREKRPDYNGAFVFLVS